MSGRSKKAHVNTNVKKLRKRLSGREIRRKKRRKRIFALFASTIVIFIVIVALHLVPKATEPPGPPGNLVVHVVDGETDYPVGYATIEISGPYKRTVNANEEGVYTFEAIPSGTYTIEVSWTGYLLKSQTVTVNAGATMHQIVRLDRSF